MRRQFTGWELAMTGSDDNKLEQLLQEIDAAIGVLQRCVPEMLTEARRRGADEVRRRIMEAASRIGDDLPAAGSRQRQRRASSPGQRGFITPLLLRTLRDAGTRGMTDDQLYNTIRHSAGDRVVHRNSYAMALKRQSEAGQIVEIDGTFFLAEHADEATSGQEDAAEPTEPAHAECDNLWDLRSKHAAA
jgi:hypothetical protein